MATITGNVFDLASAPFPAALPVLEVRAQKVSVGNGAVHATRRLKVTPNAEGTFSFTMIGTETVTPNPAPILTITWLDPETGAGTGFDQLEFPLNIPAGNGTYSIDEVLAVPVRAGSIVYGLGPPPAHLTNVIYIDISGTNPVFYGPTSGGI